MNLEQLTLEVNALCRIVGSFIKEESNRFQSSDIEVKGMHDLVSYVDREAEKMLIDTLKRLIPEAGFIAEESGRYDENGFVWIIDPLDGTTNFLHKVPVYSISIALQHNRKTILGVVYEINLEECFYAWQNSLAYLNGKQISVSNTKELHNSLIATGFPYSDFSRMEPYLKLFEDLMQNSRGLRRLGSAAVDLAYVACGRFEAFYEYALHPWDVAAGAFIVEQAGGVVCGFNGEKEVVFGSDIVATNSHIHSEFLSKTGRYFG